MTLLLIGLSLRDFVGVMRERGGSTLPAGFKSDSAALGWIASRVSSDTRLIADGAGSWNDLHARFQMDRIDHSQAYSMAGGVYTNGAEELFGRMRRGEICHHHHIAGPYQIRYAQEAARREDRRRVDNGRQVQAVMGLAMANRHRWTGVDIGSARHTNYRTVVRIP